MQKSKGLDIEFKGKMKRGIFIFVLALVASLFALSLLPPAFAAKDFIVENRTSPLFVVNGTTGNIIMTPSFGLVGIGTLNPATVLDVKGKANFTGNFSIGQTSNIFFVDNTSSRVGIGISTPTTALEVEGSVNISGGLNVTAGNVLLATTSGNVGIGTVTPSGLLHVNSAATPADSQFLVQANGAGGLSGLAYSADNVELGFDIYWDGDAWKSLDAGSNFEIYKASDKLQIRYDSGIAVGSTPSMNEGIVLDTSGKVGIGTTGPTKNLQIGRIQAGQATASPLTFSLGDTYSNTAGANPKIEVFNDGTNVYGFGVSATQFDFMLPSGARYVWNIAGSEKVRIDSSGNVGIGTTTPQNALDIVGAVTVSKGLNASNLNVTGFSIADDSLVTVVEFNEEEIKENKEKTEFHNQILQTEPAALTELNDVRTYTYLNFSVLSDDLSKAGVAQSGTAADSDSVALTGLRVRNFGLEPNSEVPSSSTQKTYSIKKVKIKDIKAGDYVLSLEETTGKLGPRKVNALLDHGIKPIYEMATEDGRAINTTAEHPYLVKLYEQELCDKYAGNVWNKEADKFGENGYCTRWVQAQYLKEGDKIAAPYKQNLFSTSSAESTSTIFSTLSNFSFDQSGHLSFSANATYSVSLMCKNNALFASANLSLNSSAGTTLIRFLSKATNSLNSCSDNLDFASSSALCASTSANSCSGATGSILSENSKSIVLPFERSPEQSTLASTTTSIYTSSGNFCLYFLCKDSEILLPISTASFSDSLLFATIDLSRASSASFCRMASLATSDQFINFDSSISCLRSSGIDNVIVGMAPTSDLFNLFKDVYAQDIFKPFGSDANSDITFVKIASIKALEPQHVYDLSIEGTRNFIANDIVAHNTYLATSSGNVGIGTTTPDNKLTIRGSDADSNLETQGILHLNITDSFNTSLTNIITLDHLLNNPENASNSKAGVTGGIGLGILFRAINNDSEIINVSFINATLVNAYNGSEASALTFYTVNKSNKEARLVPRLILNGTDVFIAPAGGKVGIGTSAPTRALHVIGDANITGRLDVGSLNITGVSFS